MQDGIFSDVEIDEAKINLINSLDMSLDSSVSILNSYVYNYLDNLPLLEERKKLYKKVTREDIINVSKKIKINTIYSLYELSDAKKIDDRSGKQIRLTGNIKKDFELLGKGTLMMEK